MVCLRVWRQVLPRKDKDTAAFMDVYEFALTRRPAGYPPQFRRRHARPLARHHSGSNPRTLPAHPCPRLPPPFLRSFVPAVRLAAWEALKNEQDFGGQLIRSEMDVLTDQFVRAQRLDSIRHADKHS